MRRHPVILGIALLALIAFVSIIAAYGLGLFEGERHAFSLREKVGIIPIEGIIGDADELIEQIHAFADDGKIKAVVLRIDSPGGGVVPSQEIYQAIRENMPGGTS